MKSALKLSYRRLKTKMSIKQIIRRLPVFLFLVSLAFLFYAIYSYVPDKEKRIITLASTFNGLCALAIAFSDRFFKWIDKPKLRYYFNNFGEPPYRKILGSHPYTQEFIIHGDSVLILRPTAAILLKIANDTDTTVKSAIAKIEKIEIIKEGRNNDRETHYYHPTDLKWSGEPDWHPVDIMPHSHHFLDLFRVINEQKERVLETNIDFYRNRHKERMITWAVNRLGQQEQIHWNVWVKDPDSRGIPSGYTDEGTILLYIVINSENAVPLRFRAKIRWSAQNWDYPAIVLEK
jgi:hypothetical protein